MELSQQEWAIVKHDSANVGHKVFRLDFDELNSLKMNERKMDDLHINLVDESA